MASARIVKLGAYEDIDLALLTVPADLDADPVRLCAEMPGAGSPVRILEPRGETGSTIAAPDRLPFAQSIRYSTLIADAVGTGNSGSGVFDAARGCLLGIMSRKLDVSPPAGSPEPPRAYKYFVPAATIRRFLEDVPEARAFLSR